MSELSAKEAAEMSRTEALRVLATAEDVPEKQRRIAQLMLDGPEISFTEEQGLRRFLSKRPAVAIAVSRALHEIGEKADRALEQARADLRGLTGF